jgi:hypothetical protein
MRAGKISRAWKISRAFFQGLETLEDAESETRPTARRHGRAGSPPAADRSAPAHRKNGRRGGFAPSALLGVALKSSRLRAFPVPFSESLERRQDARAPPKQIQIARGCGGGGGWGGLGFAGMESPAHTRRSNQFPVKWFFCSGALCAPDGGHSPPLQRKRKIPLVSCGASGRSGSTGSPQARLRPYKVSRDWKENATVFPDIGKFRAICSEAWKKRPHAPKA